MCFPVFLWRVHAWVFLCVSGWLFCYLSKPSLPPPLSFSFFFFLPSLLSSLFFNET